MSPPESLNQLARQIRHGRLSPVELLERCLDRIRRFDDRVHAWVVVDEPRARRQAEQCAQEAARGEFRGPLHGIPLGIKDIIDVAGLPTRAGSPMLEEVLGDALAPLDAPVVAGLRQAGAVILGKTVTVEFACFDPSPTRNPWDRELKRSPGGSSSGSAAAVAMGMCCGALGSQTGGSLVRPASYCGIAALKPTFNLVDRDAVTPVSESLDHVGPLAGRVADLAPLLNSLPVSDEFGPPPAARDRPAGYDDDEAFRRLPPCLGLVEDYFMEQAAEPVRRVVAAAVEELRRAGARIETARPTVDFQAIQQVHTTVMAVEAAAYHRRRFAQYRRAYGPRITELLDHGLGISGTEYADALVELREFRRRAPRMLARLDALLMPATDTTAPPTCETTGSKRFQAPWSCSGLPVVSLPCGRTEDGMPVAVQLVGRYYQDARLIQAAQWCEQRFGFEAVPPLLDEQC